MPKCDFNKLCNFIEIALWHGWSLINLPHILRTSYPKNTSEGLLLMNVRLAWYGLNIVLKFSSTTFDKILLTTGIFLVEMKITDLFCNFKKKVYERLIINKKKNSWAQNSLWSPALEKNRNFGYSLRNMLETTPPSGHQTCFGRPMNVYVKSGLLMDVWCALGLKRVTRLVFY